MEENTETTEIGELIRKMESDFTGGKVTYSKYVSESPYDDINQIEAYINSKHISGEKDSKGRDKPFANICIAGRNIWYRATDVDRKHFKNKATKSSEAVIQYVATALIQDWMKRESFGKFLNVWGLNSATYNYAVTKWVEKGGKLTAVSTPWTKLIYDPIDFNGNPKIELLEMTEAQLKQNATYDKEKVKALLLAQKSRETTGKVKKDNKNNYTKLYELHGVFSEAFYKEAQGKEPNEGDDEKMSQQMHVFACVESKKRGSRKSSYEDYTLFSGKEEEDPYLLTYLIPSTDGSVDLKGSVKLLFDAQWMTNHSVKSIKDQLDLASKLIFQTSDGSFIGQNALFSIETGDILIHKLNEPLTQINNASHDITSQQNFGSMWKSLGSEIIGTSESMMGKNPPSGTAWRQTEALLQESHDLFDLMIQNKKLAMEEMMRKVVKFVKKKMDTSKEIAVLLSDHGIDKIESMYINKKATERLNRRAVMAAIDGTEMTDTLDSVKKEVQEELNANGTQRFIKPSEIANVTWKSLVKDLEWEVEYDIPEENSETKEALATINTIITMLANPETAPFFETPRGKFLLNKALQLTGTVSPIELSELQSLPQQTIPAPMAGGVDGNLMVKQ